MRICCAFMLAAVALSAQTVVLKTSVLLDGKGGSQKNQQIVIKGGKIKSIGTSSVAPADAKVYDLRGLTVMPGWIDTHVHLSWHFDAHDRLELGAKEKAETTALYAAGNAYSTLMGGFTTVQSLGATIDGPVRDLIRLGRLPGPRVLSSFRQINENTGDPEKIRELVRQIKQEG